MCMHPEIEPVASPMVMTNTHRAVAIDSHDLPEPRPQEVRYYSWAWWAAIVVISAASAAVIVMTEPAQDSATKQGR